MPKKAVASRRAAVGLESAGTCKEHNDPLVSARAMAPVFEIGSSRRQGDRMTPVHPLPIAYGSRDALWPDLALRILRKTTSGKSAFAVYR